MSSAYEPGGRIAVEIISHKNGYSARICELHTGGEPKLIAETSIRDTQAEALQEAIAIMQKGASSEPVH